MKLLNVVLAIGVLIDVPNFNVEVECPKNDLEPLTLKIPVNNTLLNGSYIVNEISGSKNPSNNVNSEFSW